MQGAELGIAWIVPFAGVLMCIAFLPLISPKSWHAHDGKISAAWAASTAMASFALFGAASAWHLVWHAILLEYLPFMVFIAALYVVAGGIQLSGNLHGSPRLNTAILAIGGALASVMGTTGAAMVLIRPLIRANDNRVHRVHTVIFFIFIVANIGGALTPLGDPPLFLGFLQGVDFFWTTRHMLLPMMFALAVLLVVFFLLDSWLYRADLVVQSLPDPTPDTKIEIRGFVNIGLLALVVATIALTGLWKSQLLVPLLGVDLPVQDAVRCAVLGMICAVSFWVTPREIHEGNQFSWEPVLEVARLFFGIFVTMAPVLLMLKAGTSGAFAPLVRLVTDAEGLPVNAMYFWMTGILSSFVDNAPTYLVFFNLAGGDARHLMHDLAPTLTAISTGAVFMGANTYIGNAPNFMVKAMAQSRGVPMPGFFAYMMWSGAVLLPLFASMTWLFF